MFKAAIRINKIKTIAQLRGLTHHADRIDKVGHDRVREGAMAGDALALDLPPAGPSIITRVCRFVRCSPTLDRRMLEFSGSVMATGWLRRRDNAGRSGRCIRSRYGVGLRCSAYAKSPVFLACPQGS